MEFPRPVRAAPQVDYGTWQPRTWELTALLALVGGLLIGMAIVAFADRAPFSSYRYHLWRWEADTLTANMFTRLGIGPNPDATEGEEAVRNYFRITSQLRAAMDSDPVDASLVEALAGERSLYENDVERYFEKTIDEAIRGADLQRGLPLFNAARLTWPPVDFELTTPPRLLVRSPRDHIERVGDTLLKPGLSFAQIEGIEEDADDSDTVSLVVSIGGLAAYPAIVTADRTYDGMLDTASHEWVHHYLAFYPLGEQWGEGGDAETLNETTANIAGREIANLVRKAHPIELAPGENGAAPPSGTQVTVDFNKEMRELRLQVDALFEEGKVDEAEAAMEARRQFFEDNGIFIRKLNQAYFAFYGTYADGPASSNPVGPKIERVWELTQDVGIFLKVMREVTDVEDLDRALVQLEGN